MSRRPGRHLSVAACPNRGVHRRPDERPGTADRKRRRRGVQRDWWCHDRELFMELRGVGRPGIQGLHRGWHLHDHVDCHRQSRSNRHGLKDHHRRVWWWPCLSDGRLHGHGHIKPGESPPNASQRDRHSQLRWLVVGLDRCDHGLWPEPPSQLPILGSSFSDLDGNEGRCARSRRPRRSTAP